jgi:hypothetical protein
MLVRNSGVETDAGHLCVTISSGGETFSDPRVDRLGTACRQQAQETRIGFQTGSEAGS